MKIKESNLRKIIRESIDRVLTEEGVYGYPDTVDMIILDTECDRELWLGYYEPLVKALVKKANKGVELSKERLANSSFMKKFQQAAFRKFAYDQDNLDRANSPRIFREYMADKMLNSLEDYGYNPNNLNEGFDGHDNAVTEDYINEAVARSIRKVLMEKDNKGIEIDPENKGKFNATKKRTGKSTEELTHSKNPLTRKRSVFAQNAKKWNKD